MNKDVEYKVIQIMMPVDSEDTDNIKIGISKDLTNLDVFRTIMKFTQIRGGDFDGIYQLKGPNDLFN